MTTTWITTHDGAALFTRRWTPEGGIRACLQIVHGMGEHSLRYERFALSLCAAGIEVWAADMRGHGETASLERNSPALGGLPGHCADKHAREKILGDILALNKAIAAERHGIPLFLMGHSWGSFLVQGYIETYTSGQDNTVPQSAPQHAPILAGCLLSGTRGHDEGADVLLGGVFASIVALFKTARKPSLMIATLASDIYKRLMPSKRTPQDWLSRSEAEVDAYIADPLCNRPLSVGFYRDLAFTLLWIHRKENMNKIPRNLPVYVFSGSEDTVGAMGKSPAALVRYYTETLKLADVEFALYPGARHELLHETNYAEVQDNALAWIEKHIKA